MIKLAVAACALALCGSTVVAPSSASGHVTSAHDPEALAHNTGKDASHCVHVTREGDDQYAENRCDKQVFIIWCGELKYSNKRCGDGPDGGFFTNSDNLHPGKGTKLLVKGAYHWGACEGGISFGGRGEVYNDSPNGRYSCIKR